MRCSRPSSRGDDRSRLLRASFPLGGRGHDGTEFQEAQAALGFNYGGHALDWIFLLLFVVAAGIWFGRVQPRLTFRLVGRLVLGSVLALAVLVALQTVNNAVFDPLGSPLRVVACQ